ncbi:MAG: HEPN domain-containing protein [Moorella sp. (in: firmicutes)]
MIPEALEWLEQAEYNFSTAEAMFKARKYIYSIFMGQLALEKALKAIIVQKTGQAPPKTHKLVYLAEIAQLTMVEDHLKFLGILDAIGPNTRYPKDLEAALKAHSRKVAKEYLAKTREVLECLKSNPILTS